MKKKIICILLVFSLLLIGCKALSSGKAYSNIENPNNNLIVPSKDIRNLIVPSRDIIKSENFVYTFTFDTIRWNIKKARVYEQADEAEQLILKSKKIQDRYLNQPLTLELEHEGKIVKVPFSLHTTEIVEEFTQNKIKLMEYNDIILREVEVRVPIESFLLNEEFTLRVVNESGKPEFAAYLPELLDLNGEGFYAGEYVDVNDRGELVTVEITNDGLFGERPFIGNSRLFNFWYTDEIINLPEEECAVSDDINTIEISCELPNRIDVFLSSCGDFGNAILGGRIKESLVISNGHFNTGDGRGFIHEMGHALGWLADEYFCENGVDAAGNPCEDNSHFPNCAPNDVLAAEWGFDQFYKGCSHIPDNIRPNANSVMRNHWLDNNFGRINENQLCLKMAELTGQAPYCSYPVSLESDDIRINPVPSETETIILDTGEEAVVINECGHYEVEGTTYILGQNLITENDCLFIYDDRITLLCSGRDIINVAGSDSSYFTGIVISGNEVKVQDCNIYNFEIGISIRGQSNLVKNNFISGARLGISFSSIPGIGLDNFIESNIITESEIGIYLPKGHNYIHDNQACNLDYNSLFCLDDTPGNVGSNNIFSSVHACGDGWPVLGVDYEPCPTE